MTAPIEEPVVVDLEDEQVSIAPFRPDQRDALLRMYRDYPPEHRSLGLPRLLEPQLNEWLTRVLDEGENFVATLDDTVVGHAVYAPADAEEADFVIFVDPAYHGRGIGTQLLRYAIRHAGRSGVDRIVSHVEPANERALHVYDKVGFERLDDEGLVVTVGIDLQAQTEPPSHESG